MVDDAVSIRALATKLNRPGRAEGRLERDNESFRDRANTLRPGDDASLSPLRWKSFPVAHQLIDIDVVKGPAAAPTLPD